MRFLTQKSSGLVDQLPMLLKAMGIQVESAELAGAEKRAAVLGFVADASLPSVGLIRLAGAKKGGGKFTALVIVSE